MTDGAHAKGRNEEWLMKNAQQMDEMLTSITKGVGNISRHYRADWDVMSAHTAPRYLPLSSEPVLCWLGM